MKKATAQHGRTALSAVTGLTMMATMVAVPALASEPTQGKTIVPSGSEAQANTTMVESVQVVQSEVEGMFSFDQTTLTPNTEIANFFQKVSQSVCQATPGLAVDNPLGWELSVSGNVKEAFTASVGDLASEESVNKVMTCTCGGNPAGGRAIITADVKGIPVEYLLSRAETESGANTVTFISSDGTEVAFPLGYVIGHHAVLSYQVNEEDLSASVGGNNQLWMTKTPANYFVRDIAQIVVSIEDEAPAAPGSTDEHPNSPNAGVLAGTQE